MMKVKVAASLLALAMAAVPATAKAPEPPTAAAAAAKVKAFEASLHPQTGNITIPAAKAVLKLGKDYYFLPADDAKRVLTEVWGNPPESVTDVLGMVLPAGKTAFDNVWGAVVTYDDSGYVSDQDAAKQDYDQVLTDMRESEDAGNEERRKAGYAAVHLVGWAQPPSYDARTHALIWARDIRFDGQKLDTLNYDVRLLGRHGVLSLNMVSDMAHLAEVKTAAQAFGQTAAFQPGATYAEYNSNTDKAAGYGLAGLVAAGAGVAAAKKFGLLALILAFGKKFIVLILVALAAAGRFLMGLIGRRRDPDSL